MARFRAYLHGDSAEHAECEPTGFSASPSDPMLNQERLAPTG